MSDYNEKRWENCVNQMIDMMIDIYGFEGGLEWLEKYADIGSEERKQKAIEMYKGRLK